MNPVAFLGGLGTGLGGGVLSGLFGVGGGIVMVPLLGLFLGLDQHRAQGTTLAAMLLPTGLPAVLEYRRRGIQVHLPLVGTLVLGFLGGVTGGALVANSIPSPILRWGYAAFLLLLAAFSSRQREPGSGDSKASDPVPSGRDGLSWGLPIGLAAGVVSGLTGLGGAVVVIPLLTARYRMTQHEAQLTSLMMLLPPIGLPGVLVYARAQGGLPWAVIAGVIAGFLAGAFLGARLATRLSGPGLRRGFTLVLVLLALLVALRGR